MNCPNIEILNEMDHLITDDLPLSAEPATTVISAVHFLPTSTSTKLKHARTDANFDDKMVCGEKKQEKEQDGSLKIGSNISPRFDSHNILRSDVSHN